jgi:SPP1 gp7 family putative phage head morphogenesis protein
MYTGFSICEKVFEPMAWNDKTMWGLLDIKLRPFDTFNGGFTLDPYGNILSLKQGASASGVDIPLDKVVHFVHQPDIDRIYGESDLRAAYRPWWSKDIVIKFQNIHLERHASGFIWAQLAGNLTDRQKTDLEKVMKNISALMAAIMPAGVDLKSMNPMNTEAFDKAVAQYDKAISKSILVPNLLGLSEQGNVGSYSQSGTQMKAFFWILEQIAVRLAEALNEQLFRDLAFWNFGTEDFPPFTFAKMSEEQKELIIRLWNDLVGKSVERTDIDEAHIRNMLGFPDKPEKEGEEPLPGQDEIFPIEGGPGEKDELPDNEQWIDEQPEEKRENIRKQFSEKPWMKRVDFSRIKRNLDTADEGLMKALSDIMGRARIDIEKQVSKIVGPRSMGNVNPKEIEGIKIPGSLMTELRKTLRTHLSGVLNTSYEYARKEIPRKKLATIPYRPGMDKTQAERFLSSRTMKIAGVLGQRTLENVQRVLENGIRYDKSLGMVMKDLGEDTDLVAMLPQVDAAGKAVNIPARLENISRTNTAHAFNEARTALFNEPEFRGFVEAFEYSAILDDRVSEVCEAFDGRIRKEWGSNTPPNHFQCRSLLIPVTAVDEWSRKEDTLPASVKPQKGFM